MGRLFSLTYPTAAVLLAIRSGHRYGFDIMDATGLPDGTVYPILRRLERRGVLRGDWEDETSRHVRAAAATALLRTDIGRPRVHG